jgi:hypothetical protein
MEETFFVPCTRMHDRMRASNAENGYAFPEDMAFEEIELRAGAGNGELDFFHHPDFTFDDFWQIARRKIVWMNPETFVEYLDDEDVRETLLHFRLWFGYRPLFSVRPAGPSLDTDGEEGLKVYSSSVTDVTTTACDHVFQLMTRSNTIWTHMKINILPSVSTLALSQFLNNSRSSGGVILFKDKHLSNLSQDLLREYLILLEVSTGPHHRIEIQRETNWSHLFTLTVANFLQHCQCAIVLNCQRFPLPSLILDALRGDCNIVELHLTTMIDIDGLVRTLAWNKSLVRLAISAVFISDENWTVLCHSLSRHPKLEYLELFWTFPFRINMEDSNDATSERLTRRTGVFLKMLQTNTVLQELNAPRYEPDPRNDEFDKRILADVIQPYFCRLRHVRAFGTYRGPLYAQVLARALYKVHDSPALVWMLIRNNISTILELEENN